MKGESSDMTHVYDNCLNSIKNIKSCNDWKREEKEKEKGKRRKNRSDKQWIEKWIQDQFIKPLKNNFNQPGGKQVQSGRFYPQFDKKHSSFPRNSVHIRIIKFTLKKPYISRDDRIFYVKKDKFHENPIVRDKLTGFPMVKPTTWKGHLRYAAEKVKAENNKKEIIDRLFGTENNRGRLHFFPTFFDHDQKPEGVITPLSRKTRTPLRGRGPIMFEKVGGGAEAELHLFYFPYPKGANYTSDEVGEDLALLAESLKLMFYTYGFSAKKSSGYGVVNRLQDGQIEVIPDNFKEHFRVLYDDQNGAGGGGPDNK